VSVESVLFATIMRLVEHQTGKFPVFSLLIREFAYGDGFAFDCTIRHAVSGLGHSAEMIEQTRV
jgi:hypothetical protein